MNRKDNEECATSKSDVKSERASPRRAHIAAAVPALLHFILVSAFAKIMINFYFAVGFLRFTVLKATKKSTIVSVCFFMFLWILLCGVEKRGVGIEGGRAQNRENITKHPASGIPISSVALRQLLIRAIRAAPQKKKREMAAQIYFNKGHKTQHVETKATVNQTHRRRAKQTRKAFLTLLAKLRFHSLPSATLLDPFGNLSSRVQ